MGRFSLRLLETFLVLNLAQFLRLTITTLETLPYS